MSDPNEKPKLLSGGNPQIAKGYGDAVVQSYIDAMPGWKNRIGVELDALITAAFPGAQKAVKWNTPLYGHGGDMWVASFHCMTKYIKVAFFQGVGLTPLPPVASKQAEVRYFHIGETDVVDAARFTSWVKQAAAQPGTKM